MFCMWELAGGGHQWELSGVVKVSITGPERWNSWKM